MNTKTFYSPFKLYRIAILIWLPILNISCEEKIKIDDAELKMVMKSLEQEDLTKTKSIVIAEIDEINTKWLSIGDTSYYKYKPDAVRDGVWTNQIFDSARIITQKQLDSISAPDPLYNTPEHYRFSLPFFTKDKNLFLIYLTHYCGNLCAERSTRLYKKVNGKWVLVKYFYRSMS